MLVVGDDDVEDGTVGVNRRGTDEPERGVTVDDFVERLAADVAERRVSAPVTASTHLWAGWRAEYVDGRRDDRRATATPTAAASSARLAATADEEPQVLARGEHVFARAERATRTPRAT